jgi:hypothetical protein
LDKKTVLQFEDEGLSEVDLILISNLGHFKTKEAWRNEQDAKQKKNCEMTNCDRSEAEELEAAM